MNLRQERFVREYVKDLNAGKAAIRAGFSRKGAGQSGHTLLKNPEIAAAIAAAQGRALDRADLSAERTLEEMRRLAFSNVQDLFDEHGDLRPVHTLTREQAACIASVEIIMKNATAGDGKIDRILKIKIWDKPKVMEMLGKHFALLTERVRIEGDDAMIEALYAGRSRAAKAKAKK